MPKRDSDLTFDKVKKPVEEYKFFKKKQTNDNNYEELHQNLFEIVKIIDKFIKNNSYPEITLNIALKCYKLIER